MANLSQKKRENLITRINTIKKNADEDIVLLLNEIVNELTNKKYGLVWEEHSEKVDEMMSDNIPVFTEDLKEAFCNFFFSLVLIRLTCCLMFAIDFTSTLNTSLIYTYILYKNHIFASVTS